MLRVDFESRENNFSFLRLGAATLVLVSHGYDLAQVGYEPFRDWSGFDSFGGLAVSTFFVISGFLVTASLSRSRSAVKYLKNRCLRIFPALIGVVLLCAFVLGPLLTYFSLGDYLRNPTTWDYLRNIYLFELRYDLPGVFESNAWGRAVNGSLWTLPMEFAAYLLLLLIFLFGGLNTRFLFCVGTLLAAVQLKLADWLGIQDAVFLSMPLMPTLKNWTFFVAGALIFCLRDRIPFHPLYFLCGLSLFFIGFHHPIGIAIYLVVWPYLVIFAAHAVVPVLNKLDRFGDISYGVYLYAFPVQQTILYFSQGKLGIHGFNLLAAAIVFVFATLSWFLIEKPTLRLKNTRQRFPMSAASEDGAVSA